LKSFRFTGDLLGWWDDHQIVTRDQSTNFVAYDVQTGLSSNIFTHKAIAEFMAYSGLTNDPTDLAATSEWNGSNYDWYFSGDYPTPGGTATANEAYIRYHRGLKGRPYELFTSAQ
jgi:hypothetical protein